MIQSNNYYPFGLQHNTSWTRPAEQINTRLYNSGAELNEQTKNYETFYRDYDPAVGRFNQIDPLASSFGSITPYNYAFNDPVALNDPNGDCPSCNGAQEYYEYVMRRLANDGHGGYYGYNDHIGPGSGNHWSDTYRSTSRGTNTDQAIYRQSDGGVVIHINRAGRYGGNWDDQYGYRNFRSEEEMMAVGQQYYNRFFNNYMRYRWERSKTENIVASANSSQSKKLILGNTLNEYIANFLYYSPQLGIAANPFQGREAIFGDVGGILVGTEKDWGGIFILVGKDAGEILWYNELAGGAAPELGVGAEIGVIEFTGNPYEFNSSMFKGERLKFWIGGGPNVGLLGISGGIGVSYSRVGDNYLFAFGLQLGGGVSTPISGGYNFGNIEYYD